MLVRSEPDCQSLRWLLWFHESASDDYSECSGGRGKKFLLRTTPSMSTYIFLSCTNPGFLRVRCSPNLCRKVWKKSQWSHSKITIIGIQMLSPASRGYSHYLASWCCSKLLMYSHTSLPLEVSFIYFQFLYRFCVQCFVSSVLSTNDLFFQTIRLLMPAVARVLRLRNAHIDTREVRCD